MSDSTDESLLGQQLLDVVHQLLWVKQPRETIDPSHICGPSTTNAASAHHTDSSNGNGAAAWQKFLE